MSGVGLQRLGEGLRGGGRGGGGDAPFSYRDVEASAGRGFARVPLSVCVLVSFFPFVFSASFVLRFV